jgi:hypothetical protein
MPRLPVSGMEVSLRPLDGADALMLQESNDHPVAVALALLARVARPLEGTADWAALTVTDFELLVAALRVQALGPRLQCGFLCPHRGCGERVELGFAMAEYLAPVRPTRPRGVVPVEGRPGWFDLDGACFRLPSAVDQVAALSGGGIRLLVQRCLEPSDLAGPARARVERAMAVMAPQVSRPVGGHCPACGAAVEAALHLPALVITELRHAAAWVLEEVHLIAGAYGWSETAILALPAPRRQDYARRIRRQVA